MIRYADRALADVYALQEHYANLNRPEAIRVLKSALIEAEAKISAAPGVGLSAPRPYSELARPGWRWIKSRRYWIAFAVHTPPIILGVFHEKADIPGRL